MAQRDDIWGRRSFVATVVLGVLSLFVQVLAWRFPVMVEEKKTAAALRIITGTGEFVTPAPAIVAFGVVNPTVVVGTRLTPGTGAL
jgi:hypothetical protein